jgi:hypothetical protein
MRTALIEFPRIATEEKLTPKLEKVTEKGPALRRGLTGVLTRYGLMTRGDIQPEVG